MFVCVYDFDQAGVSTLIKQIKSVADEFVLCLLNIYKSSLVLALHLF